MAATKLLAAVFDIDGMLLDSRAYGFRAYEYAIGRHGLPIPDRATVAKEVGKSVHITYHNLAPQGDNQRLVDDHNEFLMKNVHLVKPYPGLHEMLYKLKSAGLKIGAFSSRQAGLLESIDQAGVTKFFNVIIGADRVTKHKPDPQGLLLTLRELGVSPEHAAMLGDAVMDVECGKNAGVALTVAITHGFGTREDLVAAKPDYIVDSLGEIPALLLAH